jgi:hypothetical protein
MRPILAFALVASSVFAQPIWRASAVTLIAASAADTITSLRCADRCGQESNPMYGQQFTPRDAGVKAAFVAGNLIAQRLILRKRPRLARWFAALNFGESALPIWAAQHNAALLRTRP